MLNEFIFETIKHQDDVNFFSLIAKLSPFFMNKINETLKIQTVL